MDLAHSVSKGGPLATGHAKRLLYQGLTRDPQEHLKDHTQTLNGLFASEDFKECVQAFLEHRPPAWKNR
jgi:enoyl-CoA hydratase/carnithine racemase